jgi:hypothetical protein
MEPTNFISVWEIQRLEEGKDLPRQIVDYLSDLGVVAVTKVFIVTREVWKYAFVEAAIIQSVWYFRKKGFDLPKSIALAKKSRNRRGLKKMEPNFFSKMAS